MVLRAHFVHMLAYLLSDSSPAADGEQPADSFPFKDIILCKRARQFRLIRGEDGSAVGVMSFARSPGLPITAATFAQARAKAREPKRQIEAGLPLQAEKCGSFD